MKSRLLCCAAAATLAFSAAGAAWAHGQAHPGHKSASIVKEQKAWGIAGNPNAVRRTIPVRMTDDMRFTPDRITVRQGEIVRFVVRNAGKMLHEMVIGTKQHLDEHAAMMVNFPDMQHEEPDMTHVKPRAAGEIVWNFNRSGEFEFACLIPGHYQAGMVGTISVTPAQKKKIRALMSA